MTVSTSPRAKVARPRKDVPKSASINLRMTPELRETIERFAEKRQRSMANEAERLLLLAAYNEDASGGPILSQYLRALGAVFKSIEAQTGKAPHEDIESYFMAQGALKEWCALLPAPKGGKEYPGITTIEKAKKEFNKALLDFQEAENRILPKDFHQRYFSMDMTKGLKGVLADSPPVMATPGTVNYYNEHLAIAKKRGNAEAIERFTKILEFAKAKEAAEKNLDDAKNAVMKDVEKWRGAGRNAFREILTEFDSDG